MRSFLEFVQNGVALHANIEYIAFMKSSQKKQYTLRNLSPQLDQKLRQRTRQTGKSLNEVALEALCRGIGLSETPVVHGDLDHLAGTWKEDPEFDQALEMQHRIDPQLWS